MASKTERVVLLHALARTPWSMIPIRRALERAGFDVYNIGYPSTRKPIAELAQHVAAQLPGGETPLHFVTHSMGGIVLRWLAKHHRPAQLGRVVMFGPPNRGSMVASKLQHTWYYRWLLGPAGQQLTTGPHSVPNALGPVDFELGVIAGTRRVDPIALLSEAGDGRVSLQEASVDGMADFIALPVSHAFMINDKKAVALALLFLQHGRFAGSKTP